MEPKRVLTDSAEPPSPEVKSKASTFLGGWFASFSAKKIPAPMDIIALATLTRLPTREVEKLLLDTLPLDGGKDNAQIVSVERKAINFFESVLSHSQPKVFLKPTKSMPLQL